MTPRPAFCSLLNTMYIVLNKKKLKGDLMTERKIDYSKIELLEPVWKDNYVAIAANSSNEYVPYLSVYLESIKANAESNTNYDVVILEQSITEENKRILKESFETERNLSLRFFNPSKLFENSNLYVSHFYLCKESYYRLGAPIIFSNYKKVIFTDVDLIFNNDPKKLYERDMQGALVLSVLEPVWSAWINQNATVSGVDIVNYSKNILRLENMHRYFNTGVMLMNIERLNQNGYGEQLLSKLTNGVHYLYQDQDILNEVLGMNLGVLPWEWNYEVLDPRVKLNANENIRNYSTTEKKSIIHWIGSNKPWVKPDKSFAYIWWQYARRSPYYEIILQRMFAGIKNKSALSKEDFACVTSYRKNVLAYWRYKLLSKITFGKTKKHYKEKRTLWKEKIKRAEEIKGRV